MILNPQFGFASIQGECLYLPTQIAVNGSCRFSSGNHGCHHQVRTCDHIPAGEDTLAMSLTSMLIRFEQAIGIRLYPRGG